MIGTGETMEIHEALKILSDVLGFDCSSFEEVMNNGTLQIFFSSKDEAKTAVKKISALADLLGHEDNIFKIYKYKDNYYGIFSNNEARGSWFEKNFTPVE